MLTKRPNCEGACAQACGLVGSILEVDAGMTGFAGQCYGGDSFSTGITAGHNIKMAGTMTRPQEECV